MVLLPATPASAHPLGNLSINEYVGVTLHRDRVDARVVVDIAEIPTLQDRPNVDTNGDNTISDGERAAYASRTCGDVGAAVSATVGSVALQWSVTDSSYTFAPGAGGLDVSRLTCALNAPATLDGRVRVEVHNGYLADRIGWREMTAVGDGIRLVDSSVSGTSVSDELRNYPKDLLTSPLDIRSAAITAEPGTGASNIAATPTLGGSGDPASRAIAALDRRFADLAAGHLTIWVGLLAVALAIILGAGHAALPGHGKTVMAAYLAGKRGRPRDALVVAGTVTLTHTGGVLALGLLITAGTTVAGDEVLSWLGLVSGVIVVAVGVSMLSAVRRRSGERSWWRSLLGRRSTSDHSGHTRGHGDQADGHSHGHGGPGHGDHAHGNGQPEHRHGVHSHDEVDHDHEDGQGRSHEHGHPDGHHHGHSHDPGRPHGPDHGHPHGQGHSHDHGHPHGRWGLAGIGLAGGLVPSPSALVVLLGAIGLGRTGFGVLLVLAYGAGMAGTLAGAGLLLVVLQRRLARATHSGRLGPRVARLATRFGAATPAVTATLVLLVGAGLALRAATAVL
jgi:ABC-type nickel/cobalt efflux system permease component RcnA